MEKARRVNEKEKEKRNRRRERTTHGNKHEWKGNGGVTKDKEEDLKQGKKR